MGDRKSGFRRWVVLVVAGSVVLGAIVVVECRDVRDRGRANALTTAVFLLTEARAETGRYPTSWSDLTAMLSGRNGEAIETVKSSVVINWEALASSNEGVRMAADMWLVRLIGRSVEVTDVSFGEARNYFNWP